MSPVSALHGTLSLGVGKENGSGQLLCFWRNLLMIPVAPAQAPFSVPHGIFKPLLLCCISFKKKTRFYLFIHERHRERSRDLGRGRRRFPTGSPMWDSIPGPLDHSMTQRQMLNHGVIQVHLCCISTGLLVMLSL